MVCRKLARLAESVAPPRKGLGGASTVKPRSWRPPMTPLHDEASAQAPCSSTIVGLAPTVTVAGRADAARDGKTASPATAAAAAPKIRRPLRRAMVGADMEVSSFRDRRDARGARSGNHVLCTLWADKSRLSILAL